MWCFRMALDLKNENSTVVHANQILEEDFAALDSNNCVKGCITLAELMKRDEHVLVRCETIAARICQGCDQPECEVCLDKTL